MSEESKFDEEFVASELEEATEKKSKSENIAGLMKNKKTRNVIIFTCLVLFSVLVLAMLVVKSGADKKVELPLEIKGVDAGIPPSSLSAGGTPSEPGQFDSLEEKVDKKRYEEALMNGESVQPNAVGRYKYTPTEVAPTNTESNQAVYNTQPQSQQSIAAENEARKQLIANANATIGRHMALWDAPKSMKMLHGGDVVAESGDAAMTSYASQLQNQSLQAATTPVAQSQSEGITLIKGGTLSPIRIDIPLNSEEINAPAVATLLSGPFAGSKLIGTFTKNGNDTITGKFTSMAVANYGISVSINANTVDPSDRTRQGIATDVDRHLAVKYGLKPLAVALSAVGQAFAKQATTTVNLNNGGVVTQTPEITSKTAGIVGVGAAAGQFAQDVASQNTQTTVTVESNSIVGVVFMTDVIYIPPNKKTYK